MKFQVKRDIVINASLKKVQDLVFDFNQWNSWSPWTIIEPDCKFKVEGASGTVGHKMSWDGEVIGSGENTVTKVSDNRIDYDLMFLKPWKSVSQTAFSFKKAKKGIKVTWTMDGSMPIFMFFMIPMMKAWIGMDYDRGLKMLKAMAENGKINAKTSNKGKSEFKGFSYVGIQRTVHMDKIGPTMQKDCDKLLDLLTKHGKPAKHWVSLYPKFNMTKMTMTYIAAVSDENLQDVDLGSEYVRGTIKDTNVFEVLHEGSYDFLGNAWSMGMMVTRAKKMKKNGIPFEYYWNSPKEVKPEKLKTSIYFPVK